MRVSTLLFSVVVFADMAHGQCECWIEPDTSYTTIGYNDWYVPSNVFGAIAQDDGCYGPIVLPFEFQFLGQVTDSIFINTNGALSVDNPWVSFNPTGFPSSDVSIIAPFWADVDLRGSCSDCNRVSYRLTTTALYVSWHRVGYWSFHTNPLNSFQVIITDGTDPVLPDGNNVGFCYGDMGWATGDSNGGEYGVGGIPATVGANRALEPTALYTQVGRFDQWGTDYAGPYGGASGISWLDSAHFVFSTADTSGVPPVFAWQFDCDTIVVQVGGELEYEMMVLAGGPGQVASVLSACTTLASYTELANVEGAQAMVTSYMAPDEGDIGFHNVTYVAYNDVETPTSSSGTLVVQVVPAQTTGVSERSDVPLFIVPNPVTDVLRFTLGQDPQVHAVEVLNMCGRVLRYRSFAGGSNAGTIDVHDLARGTYLLRTGVSVRRFVKE